MKIITNEKIDERINQLFSSLQYCSAEKQTFTTGERIMINQERFQWMHIKTYPKAEPRMVSLDIEIKLNKIKPLIENYSFDYYQKNPFIDESE